MRHFFVLTLVFLTLPADADTPLRSDPGFCGDGEDTASHLAPALPICLARQPLDPDQPLASFCGAAKAKDATLRAEHAALSPDQTEVSLCVNF